MRSILGVLATAFTLTTAPQADACGRDTPCAVDEGQYFIAMPPDADGPVPALVYIHGFGGNGAGALRNSGMLNGFLDRGYAVIAPDGMPRQNGGGRSWGFHPDRPGPRDEIAFLDAVRDDAVARHALDPDRILLGGFSIGGSMTAYYACAQPTGFAAYVPTGGNFWRPHPEGPCNGPVRLLHTHGWTDGTVPLEGRVLRAGAFVQGDVFYAFQIWRQTNGCDQLRADRFITDGPYWRRAWDRCSDGSALELALFPGGHVIHPDWPDLVADWFESLP